MPKGRLVLITGPSGVGKQTLINHALEIIPNCILSVSATTRAPREGDEDGREYYFLSKEEFERRISADGFAEYAQYAGNYYGTPRESIEPGLALGRHVLLELDVQGARQMMKKMPEAISIFLLPPEPRLEILHRRLIKRGKDSQERIDRRLEISREEMKSAHLFNYVIENGQIDYAKREFIYCLKESLGILQ